MRNGYRCTKSSTPLKTIIVYPISSDLQIAVRGQLRVPAFRTEHAFQLGLEGENVRSARAQNSKFVLVATFRFQYDFSVLCTRFKFEGRKLSKCACSELETRTRSRPRTPI